MKNMVEILVIKKKFKFALFQGYIKTIIYNVVCFEKKNKTQLNTTVGGGGQNHSL